LQPTDIIHDTQYLVEHFESLTFPAYSPQVHLIIDYFLLRWAFTDPLPLHTPLSLNIRLRASGPTTFGVMPLRLKECHSDS
jgi:hypothetical protein